MLKIKCTHFSFRFEQIISKILLIQKTLVFQLITKSGTLIPNLRLVPYPTFLNHNFFYTIQSKSHPFNKAMARGLLASRCNLRQSPSRIHFASLNYAQLRLIYFVHSRLCSLPFRFAAFLYPLAIKQCFLVFSVRPHFDCHWDEFSLWKKQILC